MDCILLKDIDLQKIIKQINTAKKLSVAFSKLADDVGENKKVLCNQIVSDCDELADFLYEIAKKF